MEYDNVVISELLSSFVTLLILFIHNSIDALLLVRDNAYSIL